MSKPIKTRVVKQTVNCMARWTQAEIQYLRLNARAASAEDIGKALGRSTRAVINKAHALGICLAYAVNRTDDQTLDNMLADLPNYRTKKELAEAYGMKPECFYEILSRRVHKRDRK